MRTLAETDNVPRSGKRASHSASVPPGFALCSQMYSSFHPRETQKDHILQRDTSLKGSIRRKRKRCGWDEALFEQLLAGFTAA